MIRATKQTENRLRPSASVSSETIEPKLNEHEKRKTLRLLPTICQSLDSDQYASPTLPSPVIHVDRRSLLAPLRTRLIERTLHLISQADNHISPVSYPLAGKGNLNSVRRRRTVMRSRLRLSAYRP